MSEKIKIRLAARCEAAGRPNNEDNYQVDADLSVSDWRFQGDEVVPLGEKGALLLVCDGMGGMNAGEVASNIAVKTVKQRFSNSNLAHEALASDEQRCDFIKRVIQEADANIKQEGNADPSKSGMGSTIVLAWLIDEKVYVGWCGDSRAYKYNPKKGFVQLSHDHSYVQELVDSGKLSPELAFDHPNNNIITRSLGDPRGTAKPDVKWFPLEENDVILLCSDGLCGVLRDNEMEQVIAGHLNSMVSCRDALWEAARTAGWHDNVTIALAQIMPQQSQPKASKPVELKQEETNKAVSKPIKKTKIWNKKIFKVCCIVVVSLLVFFALYQYLNNRPNHPNNPEPTETCAKWNEIVTAYEGINPCEESSYDKINNVIVNFNEIKECDDLFEKLKNSTEKHRQTLDNSNMGENQLLNTLDDLINNEK